MATRNAQPLDHSHKPKHSAGPAPVRKTKSVPEKAPAALDRLRLRLDRLDSGHWPVAIAVTTGSVGLVAAVTLGAAEVALGLTVGYATYQMVRYRMPLMAALRAAGRFDRDVML